MLKISVFHFNPFAERCFCISDASGNGAIIDPGFINGKEAGALFSYIRDNGIDIKAILLTHAHFDHIYGVSQAAKEYGVKVYMHPSDKIVKNSAAEMCRGAGMPVPDTSWETEDITDGQTLKIGDMDLEVIWTPGHSPGSVCYLARADQELFCGDTLFAGSIGRTDLLWGEYDDEIRSIMDKLMGLDTDLNVHPGHGGSTTIGHERTHNPFLQPFNWKDPESGYVDGIEFNG